MGPDREGDEEEATDHSNTEGHDIKHLATFLHLHASMAGAETPVDVLSLAPTTPSTVTDRGPGMHDAYEPDPRLYLERGHHAIVDTAIVQRVGEAGSDVGEGNRDMTSILCGPYSCSDMDTRLQRMHAAS